MLLRSSRELCSTKPVGQFDYGATPIQTSNFSCTDPNAYITNTLNKLILTQSSARFLFLSCTPCFDLSEQNGGKSRKICLPFASKLKHEISLLDVHKLLLYAVFSIWKRWEYGKLENRQFCDELHARFLTDDKINESWRNRGKERNERGIVKYLWE